MTVVGRAVALTATEYEILRILSVHAGRVVTSESLLRQAWDSREPTDTERVRGFVKQLRAKLGDDAANPTWIFNEHGVGYWMAKPGDLRAAATRVPALIALFQSVRPATAPSRRPRDESW